MDAAKDIHKEMLPIWAYDDWCEYDAVSK
jgi:hypothetical protein